MKGMHLLEKYKKLAEPRISPSLSVANDQLGRVAGFVLND